MANKLANRVKMTVSGTPGTGSIALGSAVTGFMSFATGGIVNGDTVPYVIEDGVNWECGVGTYSSTGPTLARTTITSSSNSNSAISATANAIVMLAPLAADLQSTDTLTSGTLPVARGGTGLSTLTAGYIPFGNGTSALGSSSNLFWDSANARLGVGGTVAPVTTLDVRGSVFTNPNSYISANVYYNSGWFYAANGYAAVLKISDNSGNFTIQTAGNNSSGAGAAASLLERMRIDSSGNVGIGTSSPGTKLDITSSWVGGVGCFRINGNAAQQFTGLTLAVNGTAGTYFYHENTNAYTFIGATTGNALVFATNSSGTSNERMRIDSAGAVGIGTTPTAGYSLSIAKNITGAAGAGSIYLTGTIQSDVTTAYYGNFSAPSTAAASFTLGELRHYQVSQGTFGSGSTVTNQYGFHVSSVLTGATNNYGFYSTIASGTGRWNFYAAGTAQNLFAGDVGIGSTPFSDGSSVFRVGSTRYAGTSGGASIFCDTSVPATTTGNYDIIVSKGVTAASGGMSQLRGHVYSQGTLSSTVTTQIGFHADSSITGATANYGFYSSISNGSNRYNFYASGDAPNSFAGSLGIGTSSLSTFNFRVNKNITGGTIAYGTYVQGAIQSDVTGGGIYNGVTTSTAAASFTTSGIYGYYAEQGTIGAGSTATNQYGYFAHSSLTGATNNYGFYSNIASGTGRWNFYAAGTAANYFGGVVEMKNVASAPTSIAAGNGVLYVEGGALKYRGSSGTVTTIAAA